MKIIYINRRVAKAFENVTYANRVLGPEMARKLYLRKDQLMATEQLGDIIGKVGGCHPLEGNFDGKFGMALISQFKLIILPDVDDVCVSYEEKIKCKSVIIIGVVDYHGNKNEWLCK